jgi:glycosyltransferase involved in cell wall biosynthesis
MARLAIVISHPIQYVSPWLQHLTGCDGLEIRVFYLWNFGVSSMVDRGFATVVQWDIPLLDGYSSEFVPNLARQPGTHHWSGLNNPELSARVNAFHPDAVLVFGYNFLTLYRFIFTRAAHSTPLIFRGDSHRLLKPKGFSGFLRRVWISQVFRQFAAFLYVGRANRDYFLRHGVAEQRLFFSPHSVDNERFISQTEIATRQAALWKQALGIPSSRRVVLFAGKFEQKKRPIDLVTAFKRAALPNVSLALVGAGPLEAQLHAEAAGHPEIFFAPFQNQSLMPRTYLLGDLFVLPSFGHGETWGLAVNEAMCLRRPILVSNHVGCALDLVQPYENGLVFPAGNQTALSRALQEAFSDPLRLERWGWESRRRIEQYSVKETTQGLFSALRFLGFLPVLTSQ